MPSPSGFWPSVPQRLWWHHVLAAPLLAVLVWFPFVRGSRVPVLGWLDLAVHEFGHVAFMWLPRAGMLVMGSGTQVMVPLALAAGLWWRSQDPLGAGIALAWAGSSAQDASLYIRDAPFQRLQLIGGVHDWGTLLGPQHLDRLYIADDLAGLVWGLGLAMAVTGCAVVAWAGWNLRDRSRSPAADPPSTWSLPSTDR